MHSHTLHTRNTHLHRRHTHTHAHTAHTHRLPAWTTHARAFTHTAHTRCPPAWTTHAHARAHCAHAPPTCMDDTRTRIHTHCAHAPPTCMDDTPRSISMASTQPCREVPGGRPIEGAAGSARRWRAASLQQRTHPRRGGGDTWKVGASKTRWGATQAQEGGQLHTRTEKGNAHGRAVGVHAHQQSMCTRTSSWCAHMPLHPVRISTRAAGVHGQLVAVVLAHSGGRWGA